MIHEIAKIGNPVLRQVATEIGLDEIPSDRIQVFIDDLIDTMRSANGAGIAANQVSVPWRVFAVEVKDNPRYPYKPDIPLTVIINPEIKFLSDDYFLNYEGCLSVPNLRGVVERCAEIRIQGFDRFANRIDIHAKGLTAGTFQHEYDHLQGILFPDRVKDTRTLCTWDEFQKYHASAFRRQAGDIVARYGS